MILNRQKLLESSQLKRYIDPLRQLKLSHRISLLIVILFVGIISFGLWSFKTLEEVRVGGPAYDRIEQRQNLVADVLPPPLYVIESYLICLQIARSAPGAQQDLLITHLTQLRKEYEVRSEFWDRQEIDSNVSAALLTQAKNPALVFYKTAFDEFLPALRLNNKSGVDQALSKMAQLYNEHRLAIDHVVELARKSSLLETQNAQAQIKFAQVLQGVFLMILLLIAVGFSGLIWLSIINPMSEALDVAKTIASGNLMVWQGQSHPDEVGQLLSALAEMGVSLRNSRVALLEGRRNAEAASRAKSIFLANMSHELRTPLNAILGFTKLLERDSGMADDSRKKLTTINRSGQHLLALINDVLEISRVEADRVIIGHQPFDLPDLLMSIEEMIKGHAEEKGLSFEVECATGLPLYVEGDGQHLKQVLINLLSNAVKYTERGGVKLRIRRANTEIQFEVEDTGRGISTDEQSHLFQAFYQTESAIAQGEGTGLGLAISLHYTHLMGGQLDVKSEIDKGSVFTLSLPLPETQDKAVHASSVQTILGLEAGQETMRILVVDDKEDNRELLRLLLEETGFEVRTASDGQQAVAVFQSWRPNLIWMDMRMPVMDGYQATRMIRGLPGGSLVKIVALTASAFEEDRVAIMDTGCDGMVSKPVEEQRLFSIMGDLLGLRYRYAEPATTNFSLESIECDFSALPLEIQLQLKVAADALDFSATQLLVTQIREKNPDIAMALDQMLQSFHFDRIAELCKACDKTNQ